MSKKCAHSCENKKERRLQDFRATGSQENRSQATKLCWAARQTLQLSVVACRLLLVCSLQHLTSRSLYVWRGVAARSCNSRCNGRAVSITQPECTAGLLARRQYPEGPATGHLDTGISWFPCVYKRMLRWFPSFQVATTCFSC